MFLLTMLIACPEVPTAPEPEPVADLAPPAIRKPAGKQRGRPAPKPCLAPPSGEGLADEGVVSSKGLDAKQIREAVMGFDGPVVKCAQVEPTAEGRLLAEIVVGCDGLVDTVTVLEDGGLPGTKVDCMQEALYYVPFPAHDLPDGMTFQYPFAFSQVK